MICNNEKKAALTHLCKHSLKLCNYYDGLAIIFILHSIKNYLQLQTVSIAPNCIEIGYELPVPIFFTFLFHFRNTRFVKNLQYVTY